MLAEVLFGEPLGVVDAAKDVYVAADGAARIVTDHTVSGRQEVPEDVGMSWIVNANISP